MQINGIQQLHGVQNVSAPNATRQVASPPSTGGSIQDQLDISPAARLMDQLSSIPDIRADRVSALRAAIADGSYETDAKLNVALDRLLDEIG